MNKLILCLLLTFGLMTGHAQKVYFVYLQSEKEQPFFVRVDEKVYSSTASGYLILSKLRDSVYQFTIGFPQSKFPEQKFSVTVKGKDRGFLLKNFGDKGWGLFDLQTLSVQMALVETKDGSMRTERMEITPFTAILAKAADDTTLFQRAVFITKVEEKKKEEPAPTQAVVKVEPVADKPVEKSETAKLPATDPAIVKTVEVLEKPAVKIGEMNNAEKQAEAPRNNEPVAEKIKTPEVTEGPVIRIGESEPIANAPVQKKEEPKPVVPEYKRSVVTRPNMSQTNEGLNITYVDEDHLGSKDTIVIFIADNKPKLVEAVPAPKQEKKFLDISSDSVVKTSDPVSVEVKPSEPAKTETAPVVTKPIAKNNCRGIAGEADFMKLRKNMASETDDDDMVDEARKYFKSKCFTTSQIRNLSVLFLDDLGKYKFFDLAYMFVSDAENFPSLQSELKNDYYINRFKAMLK